MTKPGVGLSVIVMDFKKKKVLLGKRLNAHGEGTWAFPGGHLEKWEEFEECARREVKEETGLEVDVFDLSPVAVTNDSFMKENKHYVTLFLRAEYQGGNPEILESNKCEEWRWYSWNKMPKPLFLAVENLIKQEYNPFARIR